MHKVHFTTLHIVYIINCCTYSKLSLKLESLKFLLYLVDVFCNSQQFYWYQLCFTSHGMFLVITVKSSYWTLYVTIMARLTITEYLCHKWPRICSVCRRHNPVILSSFMTYNHIFNKSIMTGATSRAATIAYPSRAHDIYVTLGSLECS